MLYALFFMKPFAKRVPENGRVDRNFFNLQVVIDGVLPPLSMLQSQQDTPTKVHINNLQ